MPKEALPSALWMARLRGFANGTFKFAKGQNPRKDSKWYKQLQKIQQCPMHNSQGVNPLFATRPLLCNCGYHSIRHQPQPVPLTATSTSSTHIVSTSTSGAANIIAITTITAGTSVTITNTTTSVTTATTSATTTTTYTGADTVRNIPTWMNITSPPVDEPPVHQSISHRLLHARPISDLYPTIVPPPCGTTQKPTSTTTQRTASIITAATAIATVTAAPNATVTAATVTAAPIATVTAAPIATVTVTAAPIATVTAATATATPIATVTATTVTAAPIATVTAVTVTAAPTATVTAVTAAPIATVTAASPAAVTVATTIPADPEPVLQRAPVNYSLRLSDGWRKSKGLSHSEQEWIGRTLFSGKGTLVANLKLWWHPPEPSLTTKVPNPEEYHRKSIFLWMPRRMWGISFKCPKCNSIYGLRSKGLYKTIRKVLNLTGFYLLAAEYMECVNHGCNGSYIAHDERMLAQLTDDVRAQFPVIVTLKYACDVSVAMLLRGRTLGNSPTALRNRIMEVHSEEWLKRNMVFMTHCCRHRSTRVRFGLPLPVYPEPMQISKFPCAKWLLQVYTRDVMRRLPELLAAATSVYGGVLKIDSTKKICKKLRGASARTATWVTNVGNERGEVLVSVVTASEGLSALQPMADGLMSRYKAAGQTPPNLIYTDTDCCNLSGPPKAAQLFHEWDHIQVRLDTWHFMRRLARGCCSESHPLYGTFMRSLSSCLFEWDRDDYELLLVAKRGELIKQGIQCPSTECVRKAVRKEEMSRHCKRQTRGVTETIHLIETLLLSLSQATDALGVSLFNEEMKDIWKEQKRHVPCLQDPPGVSLYTNTGSITKGGVVLPVLRCARGTTSLESFHLHLARFIPGTSASDDHYQAYLLEGLTRWNQARALAAIEQQGPQFYSIYDLRLANKINQLSETLYSKKILPYHPTPGKHTNELFGLDFLYQQSGSQPTHANVEESTEDGGEEDDDENEENEENEDEGFEEETHFFFSSQDEDLATVSVPSENEEDQEQEEEDNEDEVENNEGVGAIDSLGIPGWEKVDKLAQALVQLSGLSISNEEARNIQLLYGQLDDYDKSPLTFTLHQRPSASRGRFARSKKGHTTVEQMKRCFVSGGSPASLPNKSRLVEAICILLSTKHTCGRKDSTCRYVSRWKLILSEYNCIRARLYNSQALLEGTNMMLYNLNEGVLMRWYKNTVRREEIAMLLQGLTLPMPSICAAANLPPALEQPSSPPSPPVEPFQFMEPEDTYGQLRPQRRSEPQSRSSSITFPPPVPTSSSSSLISPGPLSDQLEETWPVPLSEGTNPPVPAAAVFETVVTENPAGDNYDTRTSRWRHLKRTESEEQLPAIKKPRKPYTCLKCGQRKTKVTGHGNYMKKFYYCPNEPGQVPYDVWLARVKAEEVAAPAAQSDSSNPLFHSPTV